MFLVRKDKKTIVQLTETRKIVVQLTETRKSGERIIFEEDSVVQM